MSLEERLQRLEDIEAIRQLKAQYCAACDGGHHADELLDLFTTDAVWESPTTGRFEGADELRGEFDSAAVRIAASQHTVANPVIEVDGDHATGTWYIIALFDRPAEPGATWTLARYHDKYVRVGGRWKIRHLRVEPLGRLDAGEFLDPTPPRSA